MYMYIFVHFTFKVRPIGRYRAPRAKDINIFSMQNNVPLIFKFAVSFRAIRETENLKTQIISDSI
jgi:hypothetical protein